jgi:hypothetical protein
VPQKPHRSETSSKNETGEYATFENALKTILSVQHSEIKSKLDAEKRKRIKKASASRAANAPD